MQLYTCNSTGAQTWIVLGDGTLSAFGKCIDVRDGATSPDTVVQLYTCNGTPAQSWVYQANRTLKNTKSGLCLYPNGGGSAKRNPADHLNLHHEPEPAVEPAELTG